MVYSNGRFERILSTVGELPQGMRVTTLCRDAGRGLCDHQKSPLPMSVRSGKVSSMHLNLAFSYRWCRNRGFRWHRSRQADPCGLLESRQLGAIHGSSEGFSPGRSEFSMTIIESHQALQRAPAFANSVTEIVASENAAVDHYKLQLRRSQHLPHWDGGRLTSAEVRV